MPTGMPIATDHSEAPTKSSSVIGNLRRNMSSTFSPVPIEVPQSPRANCSIQTANCTRIGSIEAELLAYPRNDGGIVQVDAAGHRRHDRISRN